MFANKKHPAQTARRIYKAWAARHPRRAEAGQLPRAVRRYLRTHFHYDALNTPYETATLVGLTQ